MYTVKTKEKKDMKFLEPGTDLKQRKKLSVKLNSNDIFEKSKKEDKKEKKEKKEKKDKKKIKKSY